MPFLSDFAQTIASSSANEATIYLLRNVPGLPPIVQTIHILAVAAVMGSTVFVALRSLRIALPSQDPREMVQRLMPWTWTALLILLISGLPFVIARPMRYFSNPVFGWKMAFLAAALLFTVLLVRRILTERTGGTGKLLALGALGSWVLVVLAGRWIAYAEYLFNPA